MTFICGLIIALAALIPAQGAIGTPLIAGSASWCAPTPRYCQSWGGHALVGAMPGYDGPVWARVCRQDDPGRCVTVRVISFCACGNHVIDLSPYAFTRLEPRLSRGVVRVEVELLNGIDELPSTDTIEVAP